MPHLLATVLGRDATVGLAYEHDCVKLCSVNDVVGLDLFETLLDLVEGIFNWVELGRVGSVVDGSELQLHHLLLNSFVPMD